MSKDELKEYILNVLMNDNGKFLPQRTSPKYLKNHNMYDIITSYYDDSDSIIETLYRIINDIDTKPKCVICGKTLKFSNGRFPKHCSAACTSKDPEILKQNAESVSKALKNVYKERGDEVKAKRAKTLKERFGIDSCSPFASKDVQNKVKQTIIDRFGVDNIFRLKEYRSNGEYFRNKSVEYQKTLGYDIEYVIDEFGNSNIMVKNGCPIHGDIIVPAGMFNNRTKPERKNRTILCPICNPFHNPETSIEAIIKNILIKHNIAFTQHDHKMIKPFELDFYLLDYNIAIECNGVYWHSGKENRNKHIKKYNLCKECGIQLLYFWEDEIINKSNIIENIILSKLNLNNKIAARKCEIKEISSKECEQFLNDNHLQGSVKSSIRYGLFYNNELVQVMTFGKLRKCLNQKHKDGTYELYRFCTLGGYTIIGGASKLLKHFINDYSPNRIITYCSKDISNADIYKKLGFLYVCESDSGFFYVDKKGIRHNRYSLRKDRVDDGSGRTADEILQELGYFKCYNLGNYKFEMILK